MKNAKTRLLSGLLLLTITTWTSCLSLEQSLRINMKKSGVPFSMEWRDSVFKKIPDMKAAWYSYFDYQDIVSMNNTKHVPFTEREFTRMSCMPFETFVLDASTLKNWSSGAPIEPYLKLKADAYNCFFAKGHRMYLEGGFSYSNNTWNATELGSYFNASKLISDIYIKKKNPLFYVQLEGTQNGRPTKRTYLVCKDKGELTYLWNGRLHSFMNQLNALDKPARTWLDTLEQDKEKMRNEWINYSKEPVRLFGGSQYSDIYYGFDALSALKECDIIPIETYMLDSLWKEKLKKTTIFQSAN